MMYLTHSIRRWFKSICAFGVWVTCFSAQGAWPDDRPITVVVPFAAGGPTDKTARDLTEAMSKVLNARFVIENRGGAGGTLGANSVARATADGYTILLHHIGFATAPALYRERLPYRTLDDFEYLGLLQEVPMTVVGRKSLQPRNFSELATWIASKRGSATMAHSGIGSASHLCALMLMSGAKLDMISIPYKGTGPAMTDLMGGQVDVMCDQTINTMPQIHGGTIKAYAVTTSQRLEALHELPTVDESGVSGVKGFAVSVWQGLYAPRGTPRPITARLNEALVSATHDPEFVAKQDMTGSTVVRDGRLSPAGHRAFVAAEIQRWGAVIRAAGQYAE